MKRKIGKALKAVGTLLILMSLVLAYCNILDEDYAAGVSIELTTKVQQSICDAQKLYANASEEYIPDYLLNPDMAMPVVEIDGLMTIGEVLIPSQGIVLPVLSEWSDSAAKAAPCRYAGSVYTDDIIIAGHNYQTHFKQLSQVKIDDEVWFTDMDGNEFMYRVSKIETIGGTKLEDMLTGEWDLTLFTCTYGGQNRLTIRCERC